MKSAVLTLLALALCAPDASCGSRGTARFVPGATPAPDTTPATSVAPATTARAPAPTAPAPSPTAPSLPTVAGEGETLARTRRRSARTDRWIDIISKYARDKMDAGEGAAGGVPRPFAVDLPLGGNEGGASRHAVTLPLLVVPLAVRVPQRSRECAANRDSSEESAEYDEVPPRRAPSSHSGSRRPKPKARARNDHSSEEDDRPHKPLRASLSAKSTRPTPNQLFDRYSKPDRLYQQPERPDRPNRRERPNRLYQQPERSDRPNRLYQQPGRSGRPNRPDYEQPDRSDRTNRPEYEQPAPRPVRPGHRNRVPPPSARPFTRPALDTQPPFAAESTVSSQQILEQFHAQAPLAPHLPPALIGTQPDHGFDVRGAFPQRGDGRDNGAFPQRGDGRDNGAGAFPQRGDGRDNGAFPQRGDGRDSGAFPQRGDGRDSGAFPQRGDGRDSGVFPQRGDGRDNGAFPQRGDGRDSGAFPQRGDGRDNGVGDRNNDAAARYSAGVGGRDYLPPAAPRDAVPPRPRFARSLLLRAELHVPRADYTEPYTAWWDAGSGAARVDYHDDGTSTYRMALPDGRMQQVEVSTDRTGEREVVRCGVAEPRAPTPDMRAPVGLPDIQLFSFAGYTTEGSARAERWEHVVRGEAGRGGGARGEALTHRHELVLMRGPDDSAMPLRYSVRVDSSVLGADCDGYEHRYLEAREQQHEASVFNIDLERTCASREQLSPEAEPEHAARLDPLAEFTRPQRDPRHDAGIQRFVSEFERSYSDGVEEAVRKNLYVQHSRFVSSCNRQDATFQVEVNFLGDRLDVELEVLLGVQFDVPDEHADAFPYSSAKIRRAKLEREFDWRPRGAVSDVRYQGSCSSCWAFAVAGSVEGALFVRTRNLVPLSEQCLVDCAHSHGAHGCRGTWPSHAYDYVQERGLPARNEYTPYQEKVLPCRDRSVPPVTHISGHVNVTPNNTNALKIAIRKEAPTVVVVDARPKSFMFYKKGVLRDDRCIKGPKEKLNHAVLAVGWGEQRGEPHFILKNTYSARWGDGGYIRLHAPSNTCGLLTVPSYARLTRGDVDRKPPAGADGADGADGEDGAVGADGTGRGRGRGRGDDDGAGRGRGAGDEEEEDYDDEEGPYK